METDKKKILILGGSGFIGKNLLNVLQGKYDLYLANRGTYPTFCNIQIDRNQENDCKLLSTYGKYDCVIDLSGFTENQVKNSFKHLTFDRYIYISSTAVNGYPFNNVSPDQYDMVEYAKNKFECENFIKANVDNYLIIRPCYIVGQGDNTNRFFSLGGEWYWKHNRKKLNYFIKVENVCQLVEKHIQSKDIGIVLPCD